MTVLFHRAICKMRSGDKISPVFQDFEFAPAPRFCRLFDQVLCWRMWVVSCVPDWAALSLPCTRLVQRSPFGSDRAACACRGAACSWRGRGRCPGAGRGFSGSSAAGSRARSASRAGRSAAISASRGWACAVSPARTSRSAWAARPCSCTAPKVPAVPFRSCSLALSVACGVVDSASGGRSRRAASTWSNSRLNNAVSPLSWR